MSEPGAACPSVLEGAVDRVRAVALDMRDTGDLHRVVAVFIEEMLGLGIDTPGAHIFFVDEAAHQVYQVAGCRDPRRAGLDGSTDQTEFGVVVGDGAAIGLEGQGVMAAFRGDLGERGDWASGTRTTREVDSPIDGFVRCARALGLTGKEARAWSRSLQGPWFVTHVGFHIGLVGYRERQHHPVHDEIVAVLARSLELGFVRFLDLQQLERRNRQLEAANHELEIERALERVRLAVADMESAAGLDRLACVVDACLRDLGVPRHGLSVHRIDPESKTFRPATRIGPRGPGAGALAIGKSAAEPYRDDDLALVQRFAEVLALGYRRHLDLVAAEARARQAEIDTSVERVRSAAMSMNASTELPQVVGLMFREMRRLGIDTPGAGVNLIDDTAGRIDVWNAWTGQAFAGLTWRPEAAGRVVDIDGETTVTLDTFDTGSEIWEPTMRAWRQGEVVTSDREEVEADLIAGWHNFGLTGPQEAFEAAARAAAGTWKVINVPFAFGTVGYRERQPVAGHAEVVRALAGALELGYLRFFDLQAAEARARNAELSRARQHVRTVVSAMENADDIGRVVDVLRDELRSVGVACDQVGINIVDAETLAVRTAWNTGLDGGRPGAEPPPPPTATHRDHRRLIELWRDGQVWKRARSENRPGDLGWVVDVPFEFGTLAMNRGQHDGHARPFTDDEVAVLRGFADVVSLGYTRFRDFERLEDQVARQEEAQRDLVLANERIQQSDRLKSEFLASMSHELRTPMNAIIGFSKIIYRRTRGVIDPRQTRNLEHVLDSAEILKRLIDDILDLSKIEAGRLEMHPERFDLRQVLEDCVATVSPLVKEGVCLRAHLAHHLEPLWSDPGRVRQIVINLLSNAVKFTGAGQVLLCLRPAGEEGVTIAVADTGIGIPQDQLDTIFEEFHQVDGTATHQCGGTGLGLSISRKLARMLGGDIEVASTPGRGATFTVTLPNQLPATSE